MSQMSLLIAAGIAFLVPISAAAQEEAAAQPEAKEALLDVYAHYRSLDSYAATMSTKLDMEMKRGMGAMGRDMKQQATIRFSRPDRVYYEADQVIVVSDGQTLAYGMPMMMQYIEQEAPPEVGEGAWNQLLQMIGMSDTGSGAVLLHPLAMLVHDEDDLNEFLAGLKDLTAEHLDDDGERRIHVTATMSDTMMGMMGADEAGVLLELWIDPQRRLLTRYRIDMTDAVNAMMKQMAETRDQQMFEMQYERAITTVDLEDQQLDPDLDAGAFAYDWDEEGYEKVDEDSQFASMFGGQTSPLLGLEAPEIKSETLDGEPFSLNDLRGDVVVLDFWATWCGPCVQAIPKIQELHEHFADQPVRVVGVNQDRGNFDAARRFVERKEITFTQVKDAANDIGQAYEVTGIPTTVVIDRQGVVQAVHVGFMPGAEKEITKQIETLLEGGTLVTEEDLERAAKRRAETQDIRDLEAREDSGESKENLLEEFHPQKLVEKESYGGGSYGQMTKLDVNGDGVDELLVPSTRANYSIIYADGSSEPLRLQGTPRQRQGTIATVERDGNPHLAYAASDMPAMSGEMRVIFGLWRMDGTRVWSSEIRHENNAAATPALAVGDVDGDGESEIILAISLTEYEQREEGRYGQPTRMQAFISVHDLDGNCLAQRQLRDMIYSMLVMESAGGGAEVVAQTAQKIVRFAFDSHASAAENEQEK